MIFKPALSALLLLAAQPARADGSCDALIVSLDKSGLAPVRTEWATVESGVRDVTKIEIEIGGKIYQRYGGSQDWEEHPYDQQSKLAALKSTIAAAAPVCAPAGSETVSGETADILITHNRSGTAARFWIGRDSGLLLQFEVQLSGTTRNVLTMDYRDVAAPEGK